MKKIIILFLFISATACAQNITAGFQTSPHGLKYKIIKDAGNPKGKLGDVIKLNITYTTQKDSVIFSTHNPGMEAVQFNIAAPQFNSDPMEGFTYLGAGDSAVFLMPTDSVYKQGQWPSFAHPGEFIKVYVAIIDMMTKEDFEAKQKMEADQQTQLQEKAIQDYLTKNNLKAQRTPDGLYYVVITQGDGVRAEAGKKITVNYTGTLLDGTPFDSSLNPGRTPFEFNLGAGQVIKGWDEGMALFNKGGKGKLIIPSALGYGNHAMGAKIPANSVLVFDVEILDVQ